VNFNYTSFISLTVFALCEVNTLINKWNPNKSFGDDEEDSEEDEEDE
jgi:hypothetical protein